MSKPRRAARSLLLTTLATALVATTSCAAPLVNPTVPPADAGPEFKEGYLDGCASGFADAGREGMQQDWRRDERRFAADAEYQRGWQSGHGACYEEERRHPKMYGADTK